MEPISSWVRPEVLALHRAVSDRTGHASQVHRPPGLSLDPPELLIQMSVQDDTNYGML